MEQNNKIDLFIIFEVISIGAQGVIGSSALAGILVAFW
jgi:hypothetical protein